MNESSRSTESSEGQSPLETMRRELERAQEVLDRAVAEYEEAVANPDVIQEDRDAAAQRVGTARTQATQLEEALMRAESGGYGVCEKCGATIPEERLEALPGATTCVSCS